MKDISININHLENWVCIVKQSHPLFAYSTEAATNDSVPFSNHATKARQNDTQRAALLLPLHAVFQPLPETALHYTVSKYKVHKLHQMSNWRMLVTVGDSGLSGCVCDVFWSANELLCYLILHRCSGPHSVSDGSCIFADTFPIHQFLV